MKNKTTGTDAEKRVLKILSKYVDAVEPSSNGHEGFPDLVMEIGKGEHKESYGVECKSIYDHNHRGDVRFVSFRKEQFNSLSSLLETHKSHPFVVVEIRPRGYKEKDFLYFYVPWEKIQEHFKRRKVSRYSISKWFILKHGINLEYALRLLRHIKKMVERGENV